MPRVLGIMAAFDHPANLLHCTNDLPPQQKRNDQPAKRECADGGEGLPVHASERGEACAA